MGLLAWEHCRIGNGMPRPDPFPVEVHFVPLPAAERDERSRRLRELLLRGGIRLAQNRKNESTSETEATLHLDAAQVLSSTNETGT